MKSQGGFTRLRAKKKLWEGKMQGHYWDERVGSEADTENGSLFPGTISVFSKIEIEGEIDSIPKFPLDTQVPFLGCIG